MAPSKLIKEDDEYIYLERFVSDDSDELPEWLFNPDMMSYKYPEEIVWADASPIELKLKYRIRKSDARVMIDGVE